jgi:predicted nucleotide-binding protein
LMQRRQQLQDSIALNPTQQSTAEATTHYLDIVTSQNNDLIQLQTQAAQQAAQKQALDAQQKSQNAQILQQRLQAQQQELSTLGISNSN